MEAAAAAIIGAVLAYLAARAQVAQTRRQLQAERDRQDAEVVEARHVQRRTAYCALLDAVSDLAIAGNP